STSLSPSRGGLARAAHNVMKINLEMNIAKRMKVFGPAFFKKLAVGKAEPYGLALAAQPGGKNQGRCHTRPEACKQGPGRFSPSFPERAAETSRPSALSPYRRMRAWAYLSFSAKLRFAF